MLSLVLLLVAKAASMPISTSLTSVADGSIEFLITNEGSSPFSFPTWFSPLDSQMPLYNLQFEPSDGIEYMGLIARRIPSMEPVVVIESGAYLKISFRPQSQWKLVPGVKYTISWAGREGLLPSSESAVFQASKNIEFVLPQTKNATDTEFAVRISNCGAASSNKYLKAVQGADLGQKANSAAHSCLQAKTCTSLYTTWYGAASASRLSSITTKHQKIDAGFAASWIAYCDGSECSPNTYAYVYPSDSQRNVYLCGAFYNTGDIVELTNTPVHEMSHFTTVAATDDYTYGQAACKSLAISNPARAISNADNIGYFVAFV